MDRGFDEAASDGNILVSSGYKYLYWIHEAVKNDARHLLVLKVPANGFDTFGLFVSVRS